MTAAALAFATGANGTGAMKLWPLFVSTTQLLDALALLVITMYRKKQGGLKFIVSGIPCIIMLTITCSAMIKNEMTFLAEQNWLLVVIGGIVFLLAIWMVIETVIMFVSSTEARPEEQRSEQV